MALPTIVKATLQTAFLNALSNVIAQVITAQKDHTPLTLNWTPILQFLLFGLISTPPNFLWQDFLESTFPAAVHLAPTDEALASAAAGDEKALDAEARDGRLVTTRLSKRNTAAKTVLDQTVGAALNTLLFSCFMHGVREAMAPGGGVEWEAVWGRARGEFWGLLRAGWRFWPFVSVVNFVFLSTVEARNLVGSLAGLGWGVYMSLFAAGN
ncbi:hypothetical protein B0T18DRAFT_99723 [Schizothecium vesticola]|uniref:Mpv17/PMP22 family protein n=1 Tax=Schizothecium vesticola TaxID=314040 RepID=A0AA40F132_9PEZI|nr:hypothetical protein B0T18DRAFT_99723 [Schizothecium vesticola]